MVAALASWLDAKAHGGQWLIRMEDVDAPRCSKAFGHQMLQQLAQCGLHSDAGVLWQSTREPAYTQALEQLQWAKLVYPCSCSRQDVAMHAVGVGRLNRRRGAAAVYPGTCTLRPALSGRPWTWRLSLQSTFLQTNRQLASVFKHFDATHSIANWHDANLGAQTQNLRQEVGDFVLKRAGGLWAYQLAVVVDDAHQGITHVVRGSDLADNTPRQMVLQAALNLPTPRYRHTPLVLAADGEKLSKQNGAQALDTATPQAALAVVSAAAQALGLPSPGGDSLPDMLCSAVAAWRNRFLS